MKYTPEQRIDIGRQIATHEITRKEATAKYDIGSTCIDKYLRLYRASVGISSEQKEATPKTTTKIKLSSLGGDSPDIAAYMAMSKEELIAELIRAKANELRAKKGYEVKGVGANKEFVSLFNKNTKS